MTSPDDVLHATRAILLRCVAPLKIDPVAADAARTDELAALVHAEIVQLGVQSARILEKLEAFEVKLDTAIAGAQGTK